MAIIYSYPETTELLPTDLLIGTSTIRVAGKKKNITKNFTLELLKNFILDGNTGVLWGTINGNINSQTDLQNEFATKQNNITLTTTGSSGPATLVGDILNIPNYTGVTYTFTSPLVNTAGVVTINQSNATTDGYLSAANWVTFNSKQNALLGTGFVKISGTTISYDNSTYYLASNPNNFITSAALTPYLLSTVAASTYFPIPTGTTSQYVRGDGSLAIFPTDIFTTLTTTGSSGSSTLIAGVLNVPTYTLSGLGGQPQLNGTGFVKASGTTISYDNSTYYLASNPSNFITSAALTPYLLITTAASTYYTIPTGTTSQYIRGDGSLATFPTASTPTLDQVLTAGNTSIIDAKVGGLYSYDNINSDYGLLEFYDSGVALKGATTNHLLFFNDDTGTVKFSNGTYAPTLNFAGVGNNVYTFQNANGTLAFLSDIPSLTGYVPTSRTLSINGTTYDLTANRSWSVGTVTSIGLSMPSAFTVSSSPVTGSGTIAVTGSGTTSQYIRGDGTLATFPTIPTVTPSALTKTDDTNVTLTLGGSPNTALLAATSLTLGWTGTLADSRITSAATWNAKQNAITLTTTGSGAATFISNVLNIPTPSLTGYVPYTGATSDLNLGANNLFVNNIFDGFSSVVASASLITLTVSSVPSYLVTGSGGQTFKMPNATTLPNGALYTFNNNQSSGAILVNNNSNTLIKSVPSGGNMILELTDNSTAAGGWDTHFQAPSNVSWSTNTFDYSGSITSATWNGVSIADNRIASSANWNTAYTNRITSLTTTGTGAATLVSNVLNIPTPPAATFTSLTTTGSSGSSTLSSGVLNIPAYTLSGLGGQPLATNLTSLSGLSYASTSFVKMTAAGTFALDTNTYLTGNQSITLSGDISGTGTTAITTAIGVNKVTNAMLAQVATATIRGRVTAGTGNVENLTGTQVTALLDTFSSTLKGLAPASGGGTTNFLRADGTWAAVGGSSSVFPVAHVLTKPISGLYYTNNIVNSATANSGTSTNFLYLYPFIPANSLTIDQLSINVATAGSAGSFYRVYIYSDNNGSPGTLLLTSSSLDAVVLGIKTYTVSFTFSAGTTYWIGTNSNSTAGALTGNTNYIPIGANLGTTNYNSYYVNTTFPTAPTTFSGTIGNAAYTTRIIFRSV
jgi:hypothetical protein